MGGIVLPFLVYTAHDGYGWANASKVPLELRERLRRAAGKMPNFDIPGTLALSGVVNIAEGALVYRFMMSVRGDSKGRDCAYLAMSYVARDEAPKVNADMLLLDPAFRVPQKGPPDTLEYSGCHDMPRVWQVPSRSESGLFDPTGSLAAACATTASVTKGTLRIFREETDKRQVSRYVYALPAAPIEAASTERLDAPAISGGQDRRASSCPWRLTLLLALLCLLMGYWLGSRYADDVASCIGHWMERYPYDRSGTLSAGENAAGSEAENR